MLKKTFVDMDKTVLEVRKAEEREMGDQIHQQFQLLTVMYQPSVDFQCCLARDMFLKPNTKAFPFVMHYLFNIYDPVEFKKRFYWPLSDRQSENVFRTTTVQYLNYLNEKHSLGWVEVKSFLVVMPGGMKFMKFLLDLIHFVVNEEAKKIEKYLPENVDRTKSILTQEDVKQAIKQHEIYISKAVVYKEEIDVQKSILNVKSSKLKGLLDDICRDISIPSLEIDETFSQSFANSNYNFFENGIVYVVNEIEETELLNDKLATGIDQFYNEKHHHPYDKEAILESYKIIQKDFPDECPRDIISMAGGKIRLESLFDAFNCILPTFECLMSKCELKSRESYEFEENEVIKLQKEGNQLESDISKFESTFDDIRIDDDVNHVKYLNTPTRTDEYSESNLILKYLQTPATYVDSEAISFTALPRLPLLDENSEQSFCFPSPTILASQSYRKKISHSIMEDSRSKIMDPLTLLRTITKTKYRTNRRLNTTNLSALRSRYKENDELIVNSGECLSQTVIGILNTTTQSQLSTKVNLTADKFDITPQKSIARQKLFETKNNLSPDICQQTNRTKSFHDTVQELDINSSPSGRLDPLVKINKIELPIILLNECPLNGTTLKMFGIEEIESELDTKKCSRNKSDENDSNVLNIDFELQRESNDKELLFNVSDSVLNDITM